MLSAGHGSKGLREYRWAWTELTRLGNAPNQHALLVREAMTTNTRGEYDRAYYLVFAPARTTLAAVAQVAGARWTIEQGFEAAKQEVGLDEYEVRKYDGWYRYITLALFAHAFLTVVRAQATPGKKGAPRTSPDPRALLPPTVPEVQHLLASVVLGALPTPPLVLHWSRWRRRHQARAQNAHYRTRQRRRQAVQL